KFEIAQVLTVKERSALSPLRALRRRCIGPGTHFLLTRREQLRDADHSHLPRLFKGEPFTGPISATPNARRKPIVLKITIPWLALASPESRAELAQRPPLG